MLLVLLVFYLVFGELRSRMVFLKRSSRLSFV